jgi:hypothetical protein
MLPTIKELYDKVMTIPLLSWPSDIVMMIAEYGRAPCIMITGIRMNR